MRSADAGTGEKEGAEVLRLVRRACGLIVSALLLAVLLPVCSDAVDTVYFTAINEQLLPLNDDTMPFWSGSTLYVSHVALEGNDLGIHANRNREQQKITLYRKADAIIFDLDAGGAADNKGRTYSGSAVLRGSTVFFPVDTVCRFFGLEYSYNRVPHGYLLRIKSSSVVLSDSAFIDAATSAFNQRFSQYERAHAPAAEQSAMPAEQTPAKEEARRTAYLLFEVTDAALAEQLLLQLPNRQATFLFSQQAAESAGDLLRRLGAGEGAIALRVDASEGPEAALRQIEDGNRALWAAARVKTRLVRLTGASGETQRAVREAGYCPIRYTLDYNGSQASAAQMSTRILSAADSGGGSCRVFLGTDKNAAEKLSALLSGLRGSNCMPAQLDETVL